MNITLITTERNKGYQFAISPEEDDLDQDVSIQIVVPEEGGGGKLVINEGILYMGIGNFGHYRNIWRKASNKLNYMDYYITVSCSGLLTQERKDELVRLLGKLVKFILEVNLGRDV